MVSQIESQWRLTPIADVCVRQFFSIARCRACQKKSGGAGVVGVTEVAFPRFAARIWTTRGYDRGCRTSPLDPMAHSVRVFHMSTVPVSVVSSDLALGPRAVAQWGRGGSPMQRLFIIVITAAASGCVSYDQTRWHSLECELHHVEMQKQSVAVRPGRASPDYRGTDFPHARRDIIAGCAVPEATGYIYVCSECDRFWRERVGQSAPR